VGPGAGAVVVGPGPGATGGAADGFGGTLPRDCDGTSPLDGPATGGAAAAAGASLPADPAEGPVALGTAWSSGPGPGDPLGGSSSGVVPGALACSGPVARSGGGARSGAAARSGPAARSGRAVSPGGTASALVGAGTELSIDGADPVVGAAMGAGSRSGLDGTTGAPAP
jgi:hypothetical protein